MRPQQQRRAALGLLLLAVGASAALAAPQSVDVPLGRPQVSQQQQQQQLSLLQPQPQQAAGPSQPQMSVAGHQAQQQQQQLLNQKLQAHLSAMQAQAQRQLGQLNGLVSSVGSQLVASAQPLAAQAANLTAQTAGRYGNVLEALANVGKVIQSQMLANPNSVQIVGGGGGGETPALSGNTKKNEYQSIVVNENQPLLVAQASPVASAIAAGQLNATQINYKEQGELLRQDILRRAGQLQQVVASSMDALKNNGDLIVRRLLEQLNHRLDVAKSKADKIINEPATNEVALKALGTINQGLNNLNNIITNIVNRLDLSAKDAQGQVQRLGLPNSDQGAPASLFLDTNRLKQNLHQLQQQFQSALGAGQQANRPPQRAN